ncbi:hypothetical protein GGI35DRAFT_79698 [Trichoderma velutinum]
MSVSALLVSLTRLSFCRKQPFPSLIPVTNSPSHQLTCYYTILYVYGIMDRPASRSLHLGYKSESNPNCPKNMKRPTSTRPMISLLLKIDYKIPKSSIATTPHIQPSNVHSGWGNCFFLSSLFSFLFSFFSLKSPFQFVSAVNPHPTSSQSHSLRNGLALVAARPGLTTNHKI